MDIKNQPVLGPPQLEGHSLMLSYRVSAPIPEEPKSLFSVDRIQVKRDVKRDVAQNHQFKYLLVFEIVVIRGHATPGQIRQPRDPSPCNDSRDRRAQHIFRGWRPGKFPVANEGSELKHRYSNFSLGLHEKPRASVVIQWWGRTPCFYEEIINRLCSVV